MATLTCKDVLHTLNHEHFLNVAPNKRLAIAAHFEQCPACWAECERLAAKANEVLTPEQLKLCNKAALGTRIRDEVMRAAEQQNQRN